MKRYIFFTILISLTLSACRCNPEQRVNTQLWYDKPATVWEEALPIGNGRMGAMIFGNPFNETIQINEESLWSGAPMNSNNPKAAENLGKIRELILNHQYEQAKQLAAEVMVGTPPRVRSYQTLGNILLDYQTKDTTQYRRSLDLERGLCATTFTSEGVLYKQESFASAPDNLIVTHLSASKRGALNLLVRLERSKDAQISVEGDKIVMQGQVVDLDNPSEGKGGKHMRFAAKLQILLNGGELIEKDGALYINAAREATLLLSAATDYNLSQLNFDRAIDPSTLCDNHLQQASAKGYKELRKRHIADHSEIFNRVKLDLGSTAQDMLPTDRRLQEFKDGANDPGLISLYFQYGRYLLMSSSRHPGVLPANLQGIWNKDYNAPWGSDFHTNINLQMNYWPAEVCNLSETALPLVNFIDKVREPGSVTAQEMYNSRGWTLHHLTDPFGRTAVMDGVWGCFPMGGPWITLPIYEHYAFTQDKKFLGKRAYPIIKSSAQFILDFLIRDKSGQWVTAPSNSPENNYIDPKSGKAIDITYGSTMDIQIITELFNNCINAAAILECDKEFADTLRKVKSELPPVKVSPSLGGIQEWIEDYKESEPGHRHISHLFGLHPGTQITPSTTELFAAAEKTISLRLSSGGGHTGWSRAWIINFYARLLDGDNALHHIGELLRRSTLKNLFDDHPPFQIDGNFGGTAGIAEMLIQSHGDYIHLLPALPETWHTGSFEGLKARGNFEVSCQWQEKRLHQASITSLIGGECSLRTDTPITIFAKGNQIAQSKSIAEGGKEYFLTTFPTEKGCEYSLKAE